MPRLLAIKTNEPGFDQIIVLVAVIGFLAIGVTFWIAWCADRRAAKENRNSKFTNVRKLIIVLIITILIGLLLPSGPQRYRTTDEEVRVG